MVDLLFVVEMSCMQNGSHLWQLALQKRKEGRCPPEPGEVAVILRAMGYPKETQIYVASGQVYGGQNRMAPLRNMFPNLVHLFTNDVTSLAKTLSFYTVFFSSVLCSRVDVLLAYLSSFPFVRTFSYCWRISEEHLVCK